MARRAERIHVEVADPIRDGVRLNADRLPISVADEDQDGIFVASDGFSTVYGAGDTPDAAIANSLDTLFAHFAYLDANRERLSPRLAVELAQLGHSFRREP